MAAVGLAPSGTVLAEDVRDLQNGSNHARRRYRAGGFSASRFACRWRGVLGRASGLSILAIIPVATRLGARIGLTAVLHTWGSALTHHPHVHVIIPGGGLSPDGSRWIACRPGFFLPVRVLSRLFLEGLAALHKAKTESRGIVPSNEGVSDELILLTCDPTSRKFCQFET